MREPDFPMQEKGFHVEGTAGAKALGVGVGAFGKFEQQQGGDGF